MFQYCTNLTNINMTGWQVPVAQDMGGMFWGCQSLTGIDLSGFTSSNITNMRGVFYYCSSLTSLDLTRLDTSKVTDMSSMFSNCRNLTSLDVTGFNTSKVTKMSGMFADCKNITSLDLSSFNTTNVTEMSSLFSGCSRLTDLNLSSLDTSNVTNMSNMFFDCENLTYLDLSGFNTSKLYNADTYANRAFNNMFNGCKKLEYLDISNFDIGKMSNTGQNIVFDKCEKLKKIILKKYPSRALRVSLYVPEGTYWVIDDNDDLKADNGNAVYKIDGPHIFIRSDIDGFKNASIIKEGSIVNNIIKNTVNDTIADIVYTKFPWENIEIFENIAIDGELPIYIKESRAYTHNNVKYVHTNNYLDNGRMVDLCSNSYSPKTNKTNVYINNDSGMHIKLYCKIPNANSSLKIFKGNPSLDTDAKYKDTTHLLYEINSDDICPDGGFEFDIEASSTTIITIAYYVTEKWDGYYAVVTPLNENEEVTILEVYTEADEICFNENSSEMFKDLPVKNLSILNEQDVIDTSLVQNMDSMFENCRYLDSVNLQMFDLTDDISTDNLFTGCNSLATIRLGKNTSTSDITFPGLYSLDDDDDEVPDDGVNYGKALVSDDNHKYIIPKYTVTFDTNEGSTISPVTVRAGICIPAPTSPTKNHYTFAGWFKDENCTDPWVFDTDTVLENITLYAKWTYEVYTTTLKTGSDINTTLKTLIGTDDISNIKWAATPWSNYASSENIALDGEHPVYAHKVLPIVTKVAHMDNVDDDGNKLSVYPNNARDRRVVHIDGAESIHIVLNYLTENNWDFVYVLQGNYEGEVINPKSKTIAQITTATSVECLGCYSISGSTIQTVELDCEGDYVTFCFYSDNSSQNYGYYATVTSESPDGGSIDLYTESDIVRLNEDSSEMFMELPITKIDMLKGTDVNTINTSLVRNMGSMFKDSDILEELDLGRFNLNDEISTDDMFTGCDALNTLYIGSNTSTGDIDLPGMFAFDDDKNATPDSSARFTKLQVSTDPHNYIAAILSYTVTFDSNGGTSVDPVSVINKIDGDKITSPIDPEKENNTFVGWYKDENCTNEWNFDTDIVTDDITLYAKWTNKLFTLTIPSEFDIPSGPLRGELAGSYFDINFDADDDFDGTVTFTITSEELDFTPLGYKVELYEDVNRAVPFTYTSFSSDGTTRIYMKKVYTDAEDDRAGSGNEELTYRVDVA